MNRLILICVMLFAALPLQAEVKFQEITTPAGIHAWLVEDHSIPFVALELRFRGGASLDPADKRGVTNLMVALLEEGSGDLDSQGFAQAKEGLAASFSYTPNNDWISVSAKFLTENRDEAVALLRDSLVNPTFDQASIERVRAQVLSIIQSDLKDPQEIGASAFRELVYGAHPYGSALNGTVEIVSALTQEDIKDAHKGTITRERLYVSAVGDITADDLATLLDDLLGELPEKGLPVPDKADVNLPGGVQVIEYPTPQSVVTFAQPGIERDHPDFFAAYILNHIIGGGGFESRLMQEVREKRGLTYGVYTFLADRDSAEIWMGSVASANDRVAEAVEVISAEWVRIQENGITQAELDDAKTYLTGAFPLRFDGNGPIANLSVQLQLLGLPADYITTRNDQVNAVTLDDVNRMAKELMDTDKLTFVVIGQPEGLETTLN